MKILIADDVFVAQVLFEFTETRLEIWIAMLV